jgi:hypothetical protein
VSNPVLALGASSVTLPMPAAGRPTRALDERRVSQRTVAGHLRTTVLSRGYVYALPFTAVPKATYDAVAALWASATAAGSYPTLQWAGGPWDSLASAVPVALALGEAAAAYADGSLYAFTLTATEADPR